MPARHNGRTCSIAHITSTVLVTLLATSCESASPSPQDALTASRIVDSSTFAEEPTEPEYRISTECQPDPADGYCIFVVPQEGEPAATLLMMEWSHWQLGQRVLIVDSNGDVWDMRTAGVAVAKPMQIGRLNVSALARVEMLARRISLDQEVDVPSPLPCRKDCGYSSHWAFADENGRVLLRSGGGETVRLRQSTNARVLIALLDDLSNSATKGPLILSKRP